MTVSKNSEIIKQQIQSRKNIILLYIILGIVLFSLGLYISDDIYPATFLYLGAIIIAFLFYLQINNLITNPSRQSLSSLKNIMFLFIAVFVFGLIVDVVWQEDLYYTSYLGAILAISGFFLMNLIVTDGNLLISGQQSKKGNKFCPNCGATLEYVSASNFCPSCGKKI
jgi:ribosomal protein S27AE